MTPDRVDSKRASRQNRPEESSARTAQPAGNFFGGAPDFLICLVLLASIAAVFWPLRKAEFITYDDPEYVTHNLLVQGGLSWSNVSWAFRTVSVGNWHPLTWLSHMLDCQLFGLNAGAHHLGNVLFHALNAVLLFAVLKKMTGARWRSAFVAALFALHPLHVESVAWVSERKDVLSTFFWILTMGAYAHYARQPGWPRYALLIICFALGLMAKPMLVTLPFVLLLLDFWPLGRMKANAIKRLLLEKIPLFGLTLASCAATYLAQKKGDAVITLSAVPVEERAANAAMSYVRYIGKMCWPRDLSIYYPFVHHWPVWQIIGALIVLASLTLLAWRCRETHPYQAVGWLWYLGTLVPVLGLVQVGAQAMADRYTYVPLIGLFIMLTWSAADFSKNWPRREIIGAFATASVLAGCVALTFFQLQLWKDGVTLFGHALAVTGESAAGHLNLGYALLAKHRPEEALVHFAEAVNLAPQTHWVYSRIGDLLIDQGKPAQAIAQYSEALRRQPDFAEAHSGLGLALAQQGKGQEALIHLAEAQRLRPNDPEFHFRFGMVLELQHNSLEAIAQYREALRLKADSVNALNNLAWILTTDEDVRLRNGAAAVGYAEQACKLTGERHAFFLGTLAAAYAEAGRFSDAVSAAQKAVERASAAGDTNLAKLNSKLLAGYRAGKTFREIKE